MAIANIKILKKIGIVFLVITVIFLAVFFTVRDHSRINKLYSEFKEVYAKDEFKGVITDLYIERGACFVTLGSTKVLLHNSGNSLYSPRSLQDNLLIGDLLIKKAESDSLFIIRGSSKYYFILGKF